MAHEDLTRTQHVEGSTDRAFGFVFAGVFLIVTLWPLLDEGRPRWWASGVAAAFALVALVRPSLLHGLNRLWTKVGLLIGRVVSPLALGVLFFGVVTPIGVVLRRTGKDPLRLRRDDAASSYWLRREPPGPPPTSMTNQF